MSREDLPPELYVVLLPSICVFGIIRNMKLLSIKNCKTLIIYSLTYSGLKGVIVDHRNENQVKG